MASKQKEIALALLNADLVDNGWPKVKLRDLKRCERPDHYLNRAKLVLKALKKREKKRKTKKGIFDVKPKP